MSYFYHFVLWITLKINFCKFNVDWLRAMLFSGNRPCYLRRNLHSLFTHDTCSHWLLWISAVFVVSYKEFCSPHSYGLMLSMAVNDNPLRTVQSIRAICPLVLCALPECSSRQLFCSTKSVFGWWFIPIFYLCIIMCIVFQLAQKTFIWPLKASHVLPVDIFVHYA